MRILIALVVVLLLTSCKDDTARSRNIESQRDIIEIATNKHPVPVVSNFLGREAVVKQVKRMDEKGKLFYVYLITPMGQHIGYYVSNTRPMSTCALLTPPEDHSRGGGGVLLTHSSPGLNGVYSRGGTCPTSFFFDAATDAYIEVPNGSYILTDQPLSIQSDPITIVNE